MEVYFKTIGGALIAAMTLLVGDHRYNGVGMDMALGAVAGEADWFDFIMKLLFTAVTLSAGFKGGEIVPTFCIGATFGCFFGSLVGLEPGVAAALSLVGLFCCATNSPFASIMLSIEMFGSTNTYLFAFVCVIAYLDENGATHTFTGVCRGEIGFEERGLFGFGYDPLFMVGDRSVAEMAPEEKDTISHRGDAMRKMAEYLGEQ